MRWGMKLVAGLIMVVLLVWILVSIGGFTLEILNTHRGRVSEKDPMFAEAPEQATRPPELDGEFGVSTVEDNSANWDISIRTPVDQTAEELAREARDQENHS